jgi:hypothetical protein
MSWSDYIDSSLNFYNLSICLLGGSKTLMSMLQLMVLALKHFVPILLLLQSTIIHFLLLMMNLLLMRYLFQFLEVDEKKLNNVNRDAVIEIANIRRFGFITHLTNDEYFKLMILKNLLQMYLRMKILLWDLLICCHYWFSNSWKKTQVSILQLDEYTNLVLSNFLVLLFSF